MDLSPISRTPHPRSNRPAVDADSFARPVSGYLRSRSREMAVIKIDVITRPCRKRAEKVARTRVTTRALYPASSFVRPHAHSHAHAVFLLARDSVSFYPFKQSPVAPPRTIAFVFAG